MEFMKQAFGPEHVSFYPDTYKLPEQYNLFAARLLLDKQSRSQSQESIDGDGDGDGAMGTAGLWVAKKTLDDNGYSVKVISSTEQLTKDDRINTVVQQVVELVNLGEVLLLVVIG